MSYLPIDPAFVKARAEYAFDKWTALPDEERAQLQPSIDRLTSLNHMGEKSAVELLHALGLFLNVNETGEVK